MSVKREFAVLRFVALWMIWFALDVLLDGAPWIITALANLIAFAAWYRITRPWARQLEDAP